MTAREKAQELVREFGYFLRDKGLSHDETFYVYKLAKEIFLSLYLIYDEKHGVESKQ